MDSFSRRVFLQGTALLSTAALAQSQPVATAAGKKHIVVVGAGAFGGWTALNLLRKGASVTLVDAWGPGNSRASSGGETRVIRAVYGASQIYVKWAARSLQLWRENEKTFGRQYFFPIGAMWMVHENDQYETPAMPLLTEAGLEFEKLTTSEAARRYPQINFDGVSWVLLEKQAGYLLARQSCQAVLRSFLKEGGEYRTAQIRPGAVVSGKMESVLFGDGTKMIADQYVFACGPWLAQLFPSVHSGMIQPTRQEIYFFGVPAGDTRFTDDSLPVWVDHGERLIYGIPGNEYRGFKIGDDTHGPVFDPTRGERTPTPEGIRAMRDFLAQRFPALKDAPVVETRVCQYENSPDGNFIIDRHPDAANVWIVGGGSGHGFKHGPALGEYTAALVSEEAQPNPIFQLSRFAERKS